MPVGVLVSRAAMVVTSIAEVEEAMKSRLLNMQHIFGQVTPVLRPVLRRQRHLGGLVLVVNFNQPVGLPCANALRHYLVALRAIAADVFPRGLRDVAITQLMTAISHPRLKPCRPRRSRLV